MPWPSVRRSLNTALHDRAARALDGRGVDVEITYGIALATLLVARPRYARGGRGARTTS